MSEKDKINTIEAFNPWWKADIIDLGETRTKYLSTLLSKISIKYVTFLVGSRRVGKTVLLFQVIDQIIKDGVDPKKILFLSLDNINLKEFDLYEYVLGQDFEYLFFDEIHYYKDWEILLKSLFDLPLKKYKIVCSGSSYKAINAQKGALTGRNTVMEMYPLDYMEYTSFTDKLNDIKSYLKYGGYPEYILEKHPNYLSELIEDIVSKDIVNIYNIRNKTVLFEVLRMLAKQLGSVNSYQKTSKVVGITDDTVKSYISYLIEVRLVESISKYSESPKDIIYSGKKHYFLDTGLRNALVGFEDIGALVENVVFIKLMKKYGKENISYLQNPRGQEVDFLIKIGVDECILVESKYKSFKEAITDKLSPLFLKEYIYNLKVTSRIVVTDGVTLDVVLKGKEVSLIGVEEFLE